MFQVLADKVHVKALSIAQRVTLLEEGLHDTSGTVCALLDILKKKVLAVNG